MITHSELLNWHKISTDMRLTETLTWNKQGWVVSSSLHIWQNDYLNALSLNPKNVRAFLLALKGKIPESLNEAFDLNEKM